MKSKRKAEVEWEEKEKEEEDITSSLSVILIQTVVEWSVSGIFPVNCCVWIHHLESDT